MADEVTFLRGLAKEWGFVELAQARLAELRQSPATSESDQRLLSQIGAEVLYLGARRIRDLTKRQAVLSEALQKFEDYLSQYGRDDSATQVLSAQAEACEYYGSFLSEKIQLEKDPDKKKELEEEALNVYMKGIKACNDVKTSLEARKNSSNAIKVSYYLAWMRKGTLLREWAKTVEKDRKVKAEEAIEEFVNLALEIGEETPIGIKALLEMAVAMDVTGETVDAKDSYQGTIDQVVERINDTDNPIRLATQALLFRFLEESYQHLTDIQVRDGELDEAIKSVETYEKQRKELDLPSNPQFADSVLLNGARARVDKGGAENIQAALKVAKDVADRHPADFIGLKARGVVKSVLDNPTTAAVGVDALMQAAQGEFQARNYGAAVRSFKRALRAIENANSADQGKYGLQAWAQIGLSFALRDRFLEASYAFIEGLKRYGQSTADPKMPGKVVDYLNRAVRGLRRQKKDKAFVAAVKNTADTATRQYSTGATRDKLFFADAQRLIEDKQFSKAIRNLTGIATKADQYELGQTMIAFAYWKSGDFAKARAKLAQFFKHVRDPLNDIPPAETVKRQYRDFAIADANFYSGMMLADEAFGRNGKTANPSKLKDVVQAFRNFGKQFGKIRQNYAERAAYELIKSLVDLEKLGEGEAEYALLRKEFPDSTFIANLAIVLFNARSTNVEAIEQEIKALAGDVRKQRELRDANQRLRAEIRKTLRFAKNYVAVERKPAYQLLRTSSKLAARIKDWDQAEVFLEKTLAVYAADPKRKAAIDAFIRPELAEIQMRKGAFPAALKQIEAAIAARPKSYALKRLKARCLGGWAEFDKDGRFVRVPGLGRFKEAYNTMWLEYGKYAKNKKAVKEYSFEYYRFYFDCLDLARKYSTQDSSMTPTANKLYRIPQSTDDFETLKRMGPKGQRLHLMFQRLK